MISSTEEVDQNTVTETLRVAVFQCDLAGADVSARIQAIESVLEEFEGSSLDLLVCPELCGTGYDVGENLRDNANPISGGFCASIAQIARRSKTAIVVGYSERATNKIYNSAACYDKNGLLLANHRKTVLPPGIEPQYFALGCRRSTFFLCGFKCEILICCEVEIPELCRAAAVDGVDLMIVPTAISDEWPQVSEQVVPSRAYENGMYVIYANHAGREGNTRYLGASCIVSPNGRDLVRGGSVGTVIESVIDRSEISIARRRLPYLSPTL